ncbi:uncharacterized protein TRAVEDRAFT_45455 [Trametes versicolor FP-101664 SS1]|uniref:uncharacterized protein n=1 Tax=Trametes versicolor (strain FP-101664) TaxID=717944 RepID=UPI0004621C60|nr:uncharacterized protein TRAVEDRAFT_45455 [Trametes versicolor FP-101664 SS1]EIW60208.1 hypothetical protein TRAVEDRAFT_45455 [Trametes versicolor FP-101664 SS1]
MSVTEIATLKLVPPHTWSSPATRSFFAAAASQQAARSGYPLHYFEDTTDAAIVYILTGWESVAAHEAWIASEANQKLLERGTGLIEVVGLQHAQFAVQLEGIKFLYVCQLCSIGPALLVEKGLGGFGFLAVSQAPSDTASARMSASPPPSGLNIR